MIIKGNKFYFLIIFNTFSFLTFTAQDFKIAFWSSYKIPCGIALHTEHLVNSLQNKNINSYVFNHNISPEELINQIVEKKIDLLHIQYDPGLMPNINLFLRTLEKLKNLGLKITLTPHEENFFVQEMAKFVDQFIYLKKNLYSKGLENKVNIIPLGVPVFNLPSECDREKIRNKYGFKKTDKIISTVGFLLSNKEFSRILQAMAEFLKSDNDYKVQLITPFTPRYLEACLNEYNKIKTVINSNELTEKVVLITDFIPQEELSERLWLSDIAYLWFDRDTNSTSASTKEFISARLPLVINSSSHFHDMNIGSIMTKNDPNEFMKTIFKAINDSDLLGNLKIALNLKYIELNYDTLIEEYIRIFKKCFSN